MSRAGALTAVAEETATKPYASRGVEAIGDVVAGLTAVAFESCGYREMSDGRSAGRLASIYDPLGAVEAIERRLAAAAS